MTEAVDRKKPDEIQIVCLDVGQGDATLIQGLDDTRWALVDCPPKGVAAALRFIGSARIAVAVVTHMHRDHAGGLAQLLRNRAADTGEVPITLVEAGGEDELVDDKPSWERALAELYLHGIAVGDAGYRGWTRDLDGVTLSSLHPTVEDMSDLDANDASIVVRVTYQEARVLIGADVGGKGWQRLAAREADLKADVFRFSHHGQYKAGDLPMNELLDRIAAELVLISVGSLNNYGHPTQEVLTALDLRQPGCRFICTEATALCHGPVEDTRSCAGDVKVIVGAGGEYRVSPSPGSHALVIDTFDHPQCRAHAARPAGTAGSTTEVP
ncbi:MAG: ComEC/Rec2 family competence protein [Candidatus Dormibacteria bacterium]